MTLDKNNLLPLNAANINDNDSGGIAPADVRQINGQQITSDANLFEATEQAFIGVVDFTGGVTGYDQSALNLIVDSRA